MYKILAINPGSTSTKVAVYEDRTLITELSLRHSTEELERFEKTLDQFSWRKKLILQSIADSGINIGELSAVIGRGGIIKPIPSGVYEVNQAMLDDLHSTPSEHASNLGALLAADIAAMASARAFIADPVVVDEMEDVSRLSGVPSIPRVSIFHALNHKATARAYAEQTGRRYEDMNFIIAHLGGGISVAAHRHGRAIDVNNCLYGEGPFSPDRCGTLPARGLMDLCFSGRYTRDEVAKIINGASGLVGYLGTNNAQEIVARVEAGDTKAQLVLDAMCYGVAKTIGQMAVALEGRVDAIILTGGIAYNKYVCDYIRRKTEFIAEVVVKPGENELEALAGNAYRVLSGEIQASEYK